MTTSRWHKLYSSEVAASPAVLFALLSDMPKYTRWLPPSATFAGTTDVEPYPVRLGSRYRDGRPGERGKEWWGTVTGFQPPGSVDFHQTITVSQLRAIVDVHIHSFPRSPGRPSRSRLQVEPGPWVSAGEGRRERSSRVLRHVRQKRER